MLEVFKVKKLFLTYFLVEYDFSAVSEHKKIIHFALFIEV